MNEVLTALLVIIMGIYAWITYKILQSNQLTVNAMRDQVETLIRPYITINLHQDISSSLFCLKITNTGKSPAQKIRLTLDRDYYRFGIKKEDRKVNNFSVFNNLIEGMSPGDEILIPLSSGVAFFSDNADRETEPLSFIVKAEYSYGDKSVTENTTIDFTPYAEALEKKDPIAQNLQQISLNLWEMVNRQGQHTHVLNLPHRLRLTLKRHPNKHRLTTIDIAKGKK